MSEIKVTTWTEGGAPSHDYGDRIDVDGTIMRIDHLKYDPNENSTTYRCIEDKEYMKRMELTQIDNQPSEEAIAWAKKKIEESRAQMSDL